MSKIAIISDDNVVLNSIAEKFVALRCTDTLVKCGLDELDHVKNSARICILCFEKITPDAIKFIKELKTDENIIILMCSEFNQQNLLEAFDAGISDFCKINTPNYELLLKVVNAQKLLDKNLLLKTYKKQLISTGVLQGENGVYYKLANALENFDTKNSVAVSLNIDDFDSFLCSKGETILAENLRANNRIVVNNFGYIILLPNTTQNQAKNLFHRLQKFIETKITGVILTLSGKNEPEIINTIARLETERVKGNLDIISETAVPRDIQEDWLDTEVKLDEDKNYKFFQMIYDKKRETVIKPVLYRAVQKYENAIEDTKFKYYVDKNAAELLIMDFAGNASLKIVFQNSPKVTITEKYSGLNTPEEKATDLKFADLTVRNLTPFIERFIDEFTNKA